MPGAVYVVGDVHGCLEELERLLDACAPGSDDTMCFLGDYVDRGPSSKGVVDRVLRLRNEGTNCVFLKGNHEDMFLSYLGYPGRYGDSFLANGGEATLASYGLGDLPSALVAERLPPSHVEFFRSLQLQACFGEFLCVHAGINPLRSLEDQTEEELLWIREEFILARHRLPYTILFGHTPQREVFLHLPFKVGLDTGVVYGNKLSCLELGGKDVIQIQRGGRRAARSNVADAFDSLRHPVA